MPKLANRDAQRTGNLEDQADIEQALRRHDTLAHHRENSERHDDGSESEHVRDPEVGPIDRAFDSGKHKLRGRTHDVPDHVEERHPSEASHSFSNRICRERHGLVTLRHQHGASLRRRYATTGVSATRRVADRVTYETARDPSNATGANVRAPSSAR